MIEEGLYSYLTSQSTITDIVGDRVYPTKLPQTPELPCVVFTTLGSYPIARQDGKAVLDRTQFQIDCYANTSLDAKLLSKAIRDVLERYVGPMGTHTVRDTQLLETGVDDFDDVPNDFRVTSGFEIWHTL